MALEDVNTVVSIPLRWSWYSSVLNARSAISRASTFQCAIADHSYRIISDSMTSVYRWCITSGARPRRQMAPGCTLLVGQMYLRVLSTSDLPMYIRLEVLGCVIIVSPTRRRVGRSGRSAPSGDDGRSSEPSIEHHAHLHRVNRDGDRSESHRSRFIGVHAAPAGEPYLDDAREH